MIFTYNRDLRKRKGFVIPLAIGVSVILFVLVFAYNNLVRGKFYEGREIMKHIRASKCAQSVCNFIFSTLWNDSMDIGSDGNIKLIAAFSQKDESGIKDSLKADWLNNVRYWQLVGDILHGTTGKDEPNCIVDLLVSDVKFFYKDIDHPDNLFFFNFEKIGRLTISVKIRIGNTLEIWQETRPFKVVCPFPAPITKFTFYWKDGPDVEPYSFNTVVINQNGSSSNGKYPLLLDNGSDIGNNNEDNVWQNRGWVYVGGGNNLILNRANGKKGFGQFFYSYGGISSPDIPVTIKLDFPNDNGLSGIKFGGGLSFRTCHFGFAESHVKEDNNDSWHMILGDLFKKYSDNKYWQSSSLHIFSDSRVFGITKDPGDIVPSITRVIGKIEDRFLELGYLYNGENMEGAVKNVGSSDEYEAILYDDSLPPAFLDYWNLYQEEHGIYKKPDHFPVFERFIVFPKNQFSPDFYKEHESANNSYFELNRLFQPSENNSKWVLDYNKNDEAAISYSKVMSKAFQQPITETYNVIFNYSTSNSFNIGNIGKKASVPEMSIVKFIPDGINWDLEKNEFTTYLEGISDVGSIGDVSEKTLGLNLRQCYKFGNYQELQSCFYTDGSLNLANLVYKLESGSDLQISNLRSSGSIFSSDSITVSTYRTIGGSGNIPAFILSENGEINISKTDGNEIPAYLVALNGTVKASGDPVKIIGGIAVKDFADNNFSTNGCSCIKYNTLLDPTNKIDDYVGIAIGPRGGQL